MIIGNVFSEFDKKTLFLFIFVIVCLSFSKYLYNRSQVVIYFGEKLYIFNDKKSKYYCVSCCDIKYIYYISDTKGFVFVVLSSVPVIKRDLKYYVYFSSRVYKNSVIVFNIGRNTHETERIKQWINNKLNPICYEKD